LQARPRRLEDRRDVFHDLLGLPLDVGRQTAGPRLAARLPGHEDELAEGHAGGVRSYGRRQIAALYGLRVVGHADMLVVFLPGGFAPPAPPTASLTRRFAGALRSAASLAALARGDTCPLE